MTTVNTYLTFNGNCEEAFNFYKSVFGGKFSSFNKYKDMPPTEGQEIPEGEKERIMHVSLPVSKETSLMGSDTNSQFGEVSFGDNFSISINTENKEEADKFFKHLSAGGKVTMPMEETFWGSYFGMFKDKFGINWMVGFDKNPPE